MSERIDAHQHFWLMERGDYGWLDDAPELLRTDFLPQDLAAEIDATDIAGTVVVQAAPSVPETEFLLALTDQYGLIKGVVGWVDLSSSSAVADLERLSATTTFKGVRPMLQDIENPRWLTEQARPEAIEFLDGLGLTFDALVLPHQLPTIIEFVERYPNVRVVLDHAGKPQIDRRPRADWLGAMGNLAQSPNVFCKFSGLVTEVDGDVTRDVMQPYVDALIEHFSPARMLWGSDWPVVNLRMSYQAWRALSEALLEDLTAQDRDAIYGANAIRVYDLER